MYLFSFIEKLGNNKPQEIFVGITIVLTIISVMLQHTGLGLKPFKLFCNYEEIKLVKTKLEK